MSKAQDVVTMKLPWPPSINQYHRHVPMPVGGPACPTCGRKRQRSATLLSRRGREWLATVDRLLFAWRLPLLHGRLEVRIVLHPPNNRKIDADNRQKPILDALKRRPKDGKQTRWLFADDDSQVRVLHTEFGPNVKDGRCDLTIIPRPDLDRQAAQDEKAKRHGRIEDG